MGADKNRLKTPMSQLTILKRICQCAIKSHEFFGNSSCSIVF